MLNERNQTQEFIVYFMEIEIISVAAWDKGNRNESKRLAEVWVWGFLVVFFFFGGVMEIYIFIGLVVTSEYVFVKIHQIVYFKRVYFIICRLYLNIVILK